MVSFRFRSLFSSMRSLKILFLIQSVATSPEPSTRGTWPVGQHRVHQLRIAIEGFTNGAGSGNGKWKTSKNSTEIRDQRCPPMNANERPNYRNYRSCLCSLELFSGQYAPACGHMCLWTRCSSTWRHREAEISASKMLNQHRVIASGLPRQIPPGVAFNRCAKRTTPILSAQFVMAGATFLFIGLPRSRASADAGLDAGRLTS